MRATAIDGQGRGHAHRRPRSAGSLAWCVVRSILAVLGALFIVFTVLGITLGGKPAIRVRPLPAVTVTRPGPGVTVTVTPKPQVSIWANHAVINVNDSPAAGG